MKFLLQHSHLYARRQENPQLLSQHLAGDYGSFHGETSLSQALSRRGRRLPPRIGADFNQAKEQWSSCAAVVVASAFRGAGVSTRRWHYDCIHFGCLAL